jgi:transposase InsO family protein
MSKYSIPTTYFHLFPYKNKWRKAFGSPPQSISPIASKRLKWVDYINKGNTILKTSRHFDIPEATIRFWFKRFNSNDLNTLENRSRKPHKVRSCKLSFKIIDRIIELRQQYKGWGKEKIQLLLIREGINVGQSRIQKVINQAGLKRIPIAKKKYIRKNRRHMYAVPREVLNIPGGLVYMDVKHLRLAGWGKVYQFTAIDHATRLMRIKVYQNITSLSCKSFLEYLDEHFPFSQIQYIGTDNGSEFLGELDKELEKREITHVFSSPRSPKQNPFVERVIRTTIDEVYYYQGTEVDLESQQSKLDNYVRIYNEIRPHKALKLMTPMEKYKKLISTFNS